MSSPVREDRDGSTAGVPVVSPEAELDSYVEKGEALKASKREAALQINLPTLIVESRSQADHLVDRPQAHVR